MSGSSKEKLLVTGTERTTGGVREVEGGNQERVIAVEEVNVLDEDTRGVEGEDV